MSQLLRPFARAASRIRRAAPLVAVAALAATGSAQAASPARSAEFQLPSLQGNVDPKRVQFNGTDRLTAWVRFPAGYDDEPDREWPVLYLLHGWEDNSGAWLDPKKGGINTVLPADFPGLVVMPEGAKAWFINWADPNANPGNDWGDYLLEEVVPFMERELRIAPGRGNHAIGGLSMGGFGGMNAVAALPSYFGHGLSFSGLLDNQDVTFSQIIGVAQFGNPGYSSVFGWLVGPYAGSVNPLRNAKEYAGSRLTVTYGTPAFATLFSLDIRARGLATLEIGAQLQARQFLDALKGKGAAVITNNRNNGSHDWRWWRQDLGDAVKRGLFEAPPIAQTSDATTWDYGTMASHGNAWGIGFRMATPPTAKVELFRRGATLTGRGRGIIRIAGGAADADASGGGTRADCTYTLPLPFTVQLPEGC